MLCIFRPILYNWRLLHCYFSIQYFFRFEFYLEKKKRRKVHLKIILDKIVLKQSNWLRKEKERKKVKKNFFCEKSVLMGSNNGQRLGITEPISLGGPSEFDVIKTRELEKVSVMNLSWLLWFVIWLFSCCNTVRFVCFSICKKQICMRVKRRLLVERKYWGD